MFPTLEQQVAELSLSQELKEFGYPQKGLWYWVRHEAYSKDDGLHLGYSNWYITRGWTKGTKSAKAEGDFSDVIIAPTCAELGYWLPEHIYSYKFMRDGTMCYGILDKKALNSKVYPHNGHTECGDTEVNVRASFLLYGLKNKLWKFE